MPISQRQLGLARRKAKRRIEAAQKQSQMSTRDMKRAAKKYVSQVNRTMEKTRTYSSKTGKKYKTHTAQSIEAAYNELQKLNSAYDQLMQSRSSTFRSNSMFGIELNRRRSKAGDSQERRDTQVFWRMTQPIWNKAGVSKEARYEAIIDYYSREYGVTNLEDIYNMVLSDERAQLESAALNIYEHQDTFSKEDLREAMEYLGVEDEFQISPSREREKNVPSPIAPGFSRDA